MSKTRSTQYAFDKNTQLQIQLHFCCFVTDEILQYICDESSKYTIRTNPNKPLLSTKIKFEQFIGILFLMSIIKMPNAKSYWELETLYDKVADVMSRKGFLVTTI